MERFSIFETKMDKVLDWSKYLLSITPVNGEVKEISSRKNLELIFFNPIVFFSHDVEYLISRR